MISAHYSLIPYLIPILLVTNILMLGCRRLEKNIQLYTFQSYCLVLLILSVGMLTHSHHSLWVALLTLLGKCILIPKILMTVIRKVEMKREVETFISLPTSMLLGGGLILLSYHLMPNLQLGELAILNEVLKAGVAIALIGLFIMVTRKKAFTEVLGLFVIDNGLFCMITATVFEMPLIIEMGFVFELLLGAMAMGLLVYRVKETFNTVNVTHLRNLKG